MILYALREMSHILGVLHVHEQIFKVVDWDSLGPQECYVFERGLFLPMNF